MLVESVRDSVHTSIQEIKNIVTAGQELQDLQQQSLKTGQEVYEATKTTIVHLVDFVNNVYSALGASGKAIETTQEIQNTLDITVVSNNNLSQVKTQVDSLQSHLGTAAFFRNEAIKAGSLVRSELKVVSGGFSILLSKNTAATEKIEASDTGLLATSKRATDHADVLRGADERNAEGFLQNVQGCDRDITSLSDSQYEATCQLEAPTPLADLDKRHEEAMELLLKSKDQGLKGFNTSLEEAYRKIAKDDVTIAISFRENIETILGILQGSLNKIPLLKDHSQVAIEYGQAFLDKSV